MQAGALAEKVGRELFSSLRPDQMWGRRGEVEARRGIGAMVPLEELCCPCSTSPHSPHALPGVGLREIPD